MLLGMAAPAPDAEREAEPTKANQSYARLTERDLCKQLDILDAARQSATSVRQVAAETEQALRKDDVTPFLGSP